TLLDELGHSLSGRTPPLFERSSARQLADLSDRLAYVCARALAATIVAPPAPESDVPIRAAAVVVAAPGGMARDPGEQTAAAGRGAVIVDERAADPLSARVAVPSAAPPVGQPADRPPSWDGAPPAPSRASRLEDRPLSWDESPLVPLPASRPEIEIRDERGDGGAAAWIGSVGRQLERFDQDGLPFAVLLVEVLDIERLYRGGRPGDASRVADAVEESIAAELRRLSGSLTRESAGRYWLLAPHTDRAGAPSLAEQLARAVASAAIRTTGASLEVAIGTAVCPDHGREAAALAAHADVELYAARSAARSSSARPAAPVDGPA
ncbi:MAG TPA: hypothetical protein VES97_00520, partial [Solirubrobacteraceae bacterium]|nr:hypothetical protein [Solirubrobacteraceae bacterium]